MSEIWNMSREKNKGVMIHLKTITTNLSTIVHILVEPITSLAKTKASPEVYFSIRQLTWAVTYSKPVVSPSLFSFFFFVNMLISNRYLWGTVESHVGNSAYRWRGINTTGKMKCTSSRNWISIIKLIKGRYIISGIPLSGEKLLLNQSWASRSDNSLIPINLS